MRKRVHFSAAGERLADARYQALTSFAGKMHGTPAIYQRGYAPGTLWARALAGVDAVGERHWVVRVVTVDTETTEHICDDRCRMARSRTCACSCGGANHGIALIQCKAA